jgi:peptidoglycan/xylan/chitin deacetylase (PgdA/CDA1 family)
MHGRKDVFMKKFDKMITISLFVIAIIISYMVGFSNAKDEQQFTFKQDIPVLCYHGVEENPECSYNISTHTFRQQMEYLKQNDYKTLTLKEYENRIKNGSFELDNVVYITFDDVHRSAYVNAVPILKEYGFTATFFVTTNLLGKEDFISKPELLDLSKNFDIGSHCKDHVKMTELSYIDQYKSVLSSKKILKEITGQNINAISYPFGYRNADTMIAVKDFYSLGFNIDDGLSSPSENRLDLTRQVMWKGMIINEFGKILKGEKICSD